MKCAGCLQHTVEKEAIKCSIHKCAKTFHLQCANAAHLTHDLIKKWICPECNASVKKGGDNTHTPIRQNDNVTFRKKTCNSPGFVFNAPGDSPENTDMKSVLFEIQGLRQDMAKMQADFLNKFDELSAKFDTYENRLHVLEEKEKENAVLRIQMAQLQEQVQKMSHESLRSDLELLGVTETPNENPYHLVLTTANKIGIELEEHDLDQVVRAGPLPKAEENSGTRLPRSIVIPFTRKAKRAEFLRQAKSRRSLDSKDIVGSGPSRTLYVNERLAAETRRLFRIARLWTKENDYKYCWVRSGVVYVRRRDGREGSPSIQVRTQADLNRLLKPPAAKLYDSER